MSCTETQLQAARNFRLRHLHPCIDCGEPCTPGAIRCWSCAQKKFHSVQLPTGSRHHSWRGGRYNQNGYIFIYRPDHPRANSKKHIAEHTVIWEQAHNQPLPDGWVVHHLNGIKDDNRPRNLQALPRRGHSPSLTVKEVQRRLREVEAELAQQRLF